MEDIYGDLENYEEGNVLDELRIENKELKCKLNEYATTLDKLQKDFDKLSSEYKKLESNYSSLLKTARAEIERKTKIITNLNLEKDHLIINSLQNKGAKPPKYHNKNHDKGKALHTGKQFAKGDSEKLDTEKCNNNANLPNLSDNNSVCTTGNYERKDKYANRTLSSDPRGQAGPDENKVKEKEQKLKTSSHSCDRDKNKINTKENKETHVHDIVNENIKSTAVKIRHRRKSMPLLNDVKFSSDEEQEDNFYLPKKNWVSQAQEDDSFRRKSILTDTVDRKHYDNDWNSWNAPKESDYGRIDDRHTNYRDSTKDSYYKYNNRFNDSDRYRYRNNRDKHETSQRSRNYYSPERSHSNFYRVHSNDRLKKSDYARHRVLKTPTENTNQRSRDLDSHRFHNGELNPTKHKINDVIDVPMCKRRRIESINWKSEENNVSQNEETDFPYSSLQSPDYITLDNISSIHQIKEIKDTASTKLDDPRLVSNKYLVNTHKNKVTLSTIVGRDVKMKCIDKTVWGIDKDKEINTMPTPLREKPQIEDLVKEIYMDIDKPILNLSLESGEIDNSEDNFNSGRGNGDITNTGIVSKCAQVKINETIPNETQSEKIQENKIQKITDNIPKKCATLLPKNYKIPKTNKTNKCKPTEDNILNSAHNKKPKEIVKQCSKKVEKEKTKMSRKLRQELDVHNQLKTSLNFGHKDLKVEKQPAEKNLLAKDIVEDDLELSDETNDCLELVHQLRNKKKKNGECGEDKDTTICSRDKEINIMKQPNSSQQKSLKQSVEKFCENKHIDIAQPPTDLNEKNILTIEETKTKDIKTKFCDLFGDSSSLITPDDLGIVEQPPAYQIVNQFAPLLDNTQDAVDFDVRVMEKVQTRSLKIHQDKGDLNKEQQETESNIEIECNEHIKKNKNVVENPTTTEHDFENVKTDESVEPYIVKTVIISTGVQNNCFPEAPIHNNEEEKKLSSSTEIKANDNVLNCQATNLKALATSTPHKTNQIDPSIPEPQINCNSNVNSISTNDANSVPCIVSNEDVSKITEKNVDVPDVRIIVRRRRKPKAAQS